MTGIPIHPRLQKPLGDALPPLFVAAQAIYGIPRLKLALTEDAWAVEYDATRVKAAT